MDNPKQTIFQHSYGNFSHEVYKIGEIGPGIILMHELPGLTIETLDFATKLSSEGFRVYCPRFFGNPKGSFFHIDNVFSMPAICINKEFNLLAEKEAGPVVDWLRSLARLVHEECGGKGVGAIGMCLTGGFAIPMLLEPALIAPAMSQPSLPISPTESGKRAIQCSDSDLSKIKIRCKKENINIRAYRFSEDILSPSEKFKRLKEEFGENFTGIEIDSSLGNKHNIPLLAHSVFTLNYVDKPNHPTTNAYEDLKDYFKSKLLG